MRDANGQETIGRRPQRGHGSALAPFGSVRSRPRYFAASSTDVTLPEISNAGVNPHRSVADPEVRYRWPQAKPEPQGLSLAISPFAGLNPRRLENIVTTVDHAADACARIGALNRRTPQNAELSRLFEVLSHSRLASALIKLASRKQALVCIDNNTNLLAYYRAGLRLIGLRASLNEGEKIAFLAHELSHVSQHYRYSDNRYFPASDLILLRRVREATAEAIATWISWELLQAGFPEPWREKKTDHFYGDVALAFEQAWNQVPGPNRDVCAARAAFDQWFSASARLDLYDRMTVNHLQRISDDDLGLVRPRKSLTHRFLVDIARLGGRNFLTQVPGRWLTDGHYADRISDRNARILDRLLSPHDPESMGKAGSAKARPPWLLLPAKASLAFEEADGPAARSGLPGLLR